MRHLARLLCATIAIAAGSCPAARAQFPDRPITMVVPAAPGGPSDVLARALGEALQPILHQPALVVNRGGAGGNIGAASVARAAPDGHTLLLSTDAPIVINPYLYDNLGIEPLRDLVPVAMVGDGGDVVLAVPARSAARTVPELVAQLRANPAQANYVSSGAGFSSHIIAELFRREAGLEATHLASRGAGAAMLELLSGRISFGFPPVSVAIANVSDQGVRLLAVAAAQRSRLLPDVPTLAEAGYPGVTPRPYWIALFAPAATPPATVQALAAAVRSVTASPGFRALLQRQGMADNQAEPAALAERFRQDATYWEQLVRRVGIKLDQGG